ncbi:MAG: biopolymer transporter ExbD [Cyclobacteriaceae bacterium]|nr:biopolymer transporter ExbD [Cyclobacteriaceae bacterium]
MRIKNRITPEINSSTMADIAFLLLIFFLVTTTIINDKGILLLLPPNNPDKPIVEIHDRNLFKIQINSADNLLINDEPNSDLGKMRKDIKAFILNHGEDIKSSISPKEAVVSLKTNRGTSYAKFIEVLNAVQGAYYDIYAANINLSNDAFRNLDRTKPEDLKLINKAKNGIPMNISIAEPSNSIL